MALAIFLATPTLAQEAEEAAGQDAQAREQPGGASAPAPQDALVDCPTRIDAGFLPTLGPPAGSLGPGETAYMPAGATALGYPVRYVVVTQPGQNGNSDAPIESIAYRLTGVNNKWGSDYRADLRAAFDKAFDTKVCSTGSCMLGFNAPTRGQRSGVELGNRAPSVPRGASGDAAALLRADFNLEGADPVYLVCHYEVG